MLKLVKLEEKYRDQLTEMMDEWTASGEQIIPYAIRKCDYRNFCEYVDSLYRWTPPENYVPDSTFFCLDTRRGIFVGAVNIRHYLNERLLADGGHVGDGIRPSERGKGYGTRMIALALEECRRLGIDEVLMCCRKANIASARTIIKNGGVLENEIIVDGEAVQKILDKAVSAKGDAVRADILKADGQPPLRRHTERDVPQLKRRR